MRLSLDAKSKILGDRYYLHYLVAQSNYSKIFLATDLAIDNRRCAIKQLYPNYYPAEIRSKVESAFLQEAQVLKKFAQKHPQICQYYSFLVNSGNQYIVQEWVEGTTLEEKLRQKPRLLETEIKNIILNILLILEYVHSQGIVHNDIKPSNIILRLQNKLPVLIDFGVAKKINTDYGQNIVGTPGYMSVEQAMGKATFSNDLYSLGLTAIHLLTGKSPLGTDFNLEQNNFWCQMKAAFDPKLVAVIDRAISARSDKRFASAREMLNMLQSSKVISISIAKKSNRPKLKLNDSILTLILAMLGMGFYLNYLTQLSVEFSPKVVNSRDSEHLIAPDSDFRPQPIVSEYLIPESIDDIPQPPAVINKNTDNLLQAAIFVPGTTQSEILETLGEPLWRQPGFWVNSVAWFYQDIVSPEFDMGYIFDRYTNKLRQVEIAVPPTTQLSTIQSAMNSFLAQEQSTDAIERGLRAVYQRQRDSYNFGVGNLQGVIQRNHKDRIYMAVWEADFH